MTKPNKFASVGAAIQERRQAESRAAPVQEELPPQGQQSEGEQRPPKSKRGRPKGGKRSDPSYQQITLYMPSSLYLGVQKKLKQRRRNEGYEGPRDMSDLVSSLVEAWNRDV